MKIGADEILNQHLSLAKGMQEVGPDPFFYTRLKARIDKKYTNTTLELPIKPVWIIGVLMMLLALNGLLMIQESTSAKGNNDKAILALAASYDQVVSD